MYNGKVLLMLHQLQAGEYGLKPPATSAIGNGFLLWVFVEDLEQVFLRAKQPDAEIIVQPHEVLPSTR